MGTPGDRPQGRQGRGPEVVWDHQWPARDSSLPFRDRFSGTRNLKPPALKDRELRSPLLFILHRQRLWVASFASPFRSGSRFARAGMTMVGTIGEAGKRPITHPKVLGEADAEIAGDLDRDRAHRAFREAPRPSALASHDLVRWGDVRLLDPGRVLPEQIPLVMAVSDGLDCFTPTTAMSLCS